MHDLAFFRNDFDRLAERLATRGNAPALDRFRDLDAQRRAAIRRAEELKSRKNIETAEIQKLKREGADTSERQKQMRAIGEQISTLDAQVKSVYEEFHELL